jgi:UTP--glucose-1-phosphate uridylyltransferase
MKSLEMEGLELFFDPFAEKMAAEDLPPVVIETFRHYFTLLASGETGRISRDEIAAVQKGEITDLDNLSDFEKNGQNAIEKAVVIKLNGGLGTSMGLWGAKSLLEVKKGLSFLDITARQILDDRKRYGARLPVVFMNSFRTEEDTLRVLASYPDLPTRNIGLSFLQHKFPKILQKGLRPASWPQDPEMEWNPPGHGDIYNALVTSGMLEKLLAKNIVYAFVSNSDNLGATFDKRILGYFADKNIPFLMEVTDRTKADSKGGHLARLKQGGLTLREIAQCPPDELDEFQDIFLYRYFNTNSIWINLKNLEQLMNGGSRILPLAMIRNPKFLNPRDESSPAVFQLETAMGSAISVFKGAEAIRVPRTRFVPVKKCRDLLVVWSDLYLLNERYELVRNPSKPKQVLVDLDDEYYHKIDDLKARFPFGAPSLLECTSLTVRGDVAFGKDVKIRGIVKIHNNTDGRVRIPDGSIIEKDIIFD